MLDFVARQFQVEGARLVVETRRDPASEQIDVGDHAIAAMAVEDDGAGCNCFHGRGKERKERR